MIAQRGDFGRPVTAPLPPGRTRPASPQPGNRDERGCVVCGHDQALHVWEFDDCCSGPGPTKYGCGCPEFATAPADQPEPYSAEAADELVKDLAHDLGIPAPAPSAGQDTGQLRDEIAEIVYDRDSFAGDLHWSRTHPQERDRCLRIANRIVEHLRSLDGPPRGDRPC